MFFITSVMLHKNTTINCYCITIGRLNYPNSENMTDEEVKTKELNLQTMKKTITFVAYGHNNIKGTHKTTLEITKEDYLTPQGDCIIGIRSTLACSDIPREVLQIAQNVDCRITLKLCANGKIEQIRGTGHPSLTYLDKTSFVVRKSNYVCPRTLMINADKSAKDLDRSFINIIKNEKAIIKGIIEFEIK